MTDNKRVNLVVTTEDRYNYILPSNVLEDLVHKAQVMTVRESLRLLELANYYSAINTLTTPGKFDTPISLIAKTLKELESYRG